MVILHICNSYFYDKKQNIIPNKFATLAAIPLFFAPKADFLIKSALYFWQYMRNQIGNFTHFV
jgi:hypothetical protein